MNLVLAHPLHKTRRARGQSSYAHEVFSKSGMEDAVGLLGSVMSPRAQGHKFCSDLMFYRWNRSFRAAKEKIEDVKENLEGEKEKMSENF